MSTEPDHHEGGSPGPADWLTIPGRLLLILTLIGFAGGYGLYMLWGLENLPRGSYPILFFIVPVLLVAALFFVVTAFVLERLGIHIYRRRDRQE